MYFMSSLNLFQNKKYNVIKTHKNTFSFAPFLSLVFVYLFIYLFNMLVTQYNINYYIIDITIHKLVVTVAGIDCLRRYLEIQDGGCAEQMT